MAAPHLKVVASAADTKRSVIEIAGVSKTYRTRDGEVPSLRPLDFSADAGEFLAVGPLSLRQVHVAQDDRRPAAAERRRNSRAGPRGDAPAFRRRHCVPEPAAAA